MVRVRVTVSIRVRERVRVRKIVRCSVTAGVRLGLG